jgi:hypothetical protein
MMDVLKSYIALACVAFMVGFIGYWVLGHALAGGPEPTAPAYQAPASATLPALDLNRGKRI